MTSTIIAVILPTPVRGVRNPSIAIVGIVYIRPVKLRTGNLKYLYWLINIPSPRPSIVDIITAIEDM